jgi:hypothetical protein
VVSKSSISDAAAMGSPDVSASSATCASAQASADVPQPLDQKDAALRQVAFSCTEFLFI